ncbi:hypothetical protein [Streptomyces sp. TP-A0875]|uniref:hypothetical protein n=1 Tax=Streptomyces sp. TP-A0875 TaxID=552354 RepID=UPI0006B5F907|nr:hypothetical protein [Streptomyces sp. TP-A0875]
MRPTMYGYMRLAVNGDGADESNATERELAAHAHREGFALRRLFIERLNDDESALFSLSEAIKDSGVKHVIVPSLWHFARLPGLQLAMREQIEQELGVKLWVVQGVAR